MGLRVAMTIYGDTAIHGTHVAVAAHPMHLLSAKTHLVQGQEAVDQALLGHTVRILKTLQIFDSHTLHLPVYRPRSQHLLTLGLVPETIEIGKRRLRGGATPSRLILVGSYPRLFCSGVRTARSNRAATLAARKSAGRT